ncbi:hypothetical protein HMPREF1981_02201 [Bacteroides pyogenes F0041]|nr:hypothetical protein HMPREF1981_02201 [Bacteroides pyogenes F0041]
MSVVVKKLKGCKLFPVKIKSKRQKRAKGLVLQSSVHYICETDKRILMLWACNCRALCSRYLTGKDYEASCLYIFRRSNMENGITPEELQQQLEEFYPNIRADLTMAYSYIDICGEYAEVDGYADWLISCGCGEADCS